MTATNQAGQVCLDVSPDVDHKFGGFMNELWVEPEHVEPDVPRLNAAKGRPTFHEVIHLAHGGSTFGHLRALGAKRVIGAEDSLTTGPASIVPRTHALLRVAYWRAFNRALPRLPGVRAPRYSTSRGTIVSASELKVGLRGRSGLPIVLWSGTAWDDLLFGWWACDALIRSKVSPSDIWVASTTAEFNRHAKRQLPSAAHADDDDVLRVFTFSRRCTSAFLRSGARLWRAFTTGDLGALQRSVSLPAPAAAFVPQVQSIGRKKRFRLSAYDSRLLGMFASGDWSMAMGRLKDATTRHAFMSLLDGYGDLLIPVRLADWAAHAPAVLECRPTGQATSYLHAAEYRLTKKGMAIVREGLPDLAIAPEMVVGGFVAYAPDSKWGCETVDGEWRFVRL